MPWLTRLLVIALACGIAVVESACVTAEQLTQNRKELSSGHVGCSPDRVIVGDETDRTWTARCKKKKTLYHCSVAGIAPNETISCKAAEDD